ncbi:MAG: SDR family oxidoreductase [Deltaproteobacteria bacterium]
MILVVGATSSLGRRVVAALREKGTPVRALTRDPSRAADLAALGVEVVQGDLRDPASIQRACRGVEKVLSSAHGFDGKDGNSPVAVDLEGNQELVRAARQAGVGHFVLVSAVGAGPEHPVDLFRCKYGAEEAVRRGGMPFAIVRATAFMEFWAAMVGEPILRAGKVTLFGRGRNPINFVSVGDVAPYVLLALEDPRAEGCTLEVGGLENLSLLQVAEIFEKEAGSPARRTHVPLALMRVLAVALRPVNPGLARQVAAGVVMDTADMTFEMREPLGPSPLRFTRVADVARRMASERSQAQSPARR